MRSPSGRGLFRSTVLGAGLMAAAAGLDTAVRGVRSFPGVADGGSAALESETRFFGGVYLAFGLQTIRTARHADEDVTAVRVLAGTVLLAGLARGRGWVLDGPPHPAQRGLLAAELLGPPALLAWQAALRKRPA